MDHLNHLFDAETPKKVRALREIFRDMSTVSGSRPSRESEQLDGVQLEAEDSTEFFLAVLQSVPDADLDLAIEKLLEMNASEPEASGSAGEQRRRAETYERQKVQRENSIRSQMRKLPLDALRDNAAALSTPPRAGTGASLSPLASPAPPHERVQQGARPVQTGTRPVLQGTAPQRPVLQGTPPAHWDRSPLSLCHSGYVKARGGEPLQRMTSSGRLLSPSPPPPPSTSAYGTGTGLQNFAGENNCFLNCAVQLLFHTPIFRAKLLQYDGVHQCGDSCLLCALRVLFLQMVEVANGGVVPSTLLRHVLASLHEDRHKFTIGAFDDAAEALEAILSGLHETLVTDAGHTQAEYCCLAHEAMGVDISAWSYCTNCGQLLCEDDGSGGDGGGGSHEHPLRFVEFVRYVPLVHLLEERGRHPAWSFARCVRELGNTAVFRCAGSGCRKYGTVRLTLDRAPRTVLVGLVYEGAAGAGAGATDDDNEVACAWTSIDERFDALEFCEFTKYSATAAAALRSASSRGTEQQQLLVDLSDIDVEAGRLSPSMVRVHDKGLEFLIDAFSDLPPAEISRLLLQNGLDMRATYRCCLARRRELQSASAVCDDDAAQTAAARHMFALRSVICWYGAHYTTIVKNPSSGIWTLFDDKTVKPIGKSWEDVLHRCVRARMRPFLLSYDALDDVALSPAS